MEEDPSTELATRSEEEESEIQPSPHNSSDAGSGDDKATNSNDNSSTGRDGSKIEVAISIGEEEREIQSDNESPATLSESDSDDDSPSDHDASPGRDGSKIEVLDLELIFLLANFIVELMLIAFDQLSSQYKAPFLLLCLIMSISAVLISISELVYKLIKERDFWKGVTNWRSWLFDPPPGVRVGFFPCIIALTCAFGQFIITTVNYSLYRKDGNAPIKVSIWPTIFAFGQLISSISSRGAKTENKPECWIDFCHEIVLDWLEPKLPLELKLLTESAPVDPNRVQAEDHANVHSQAQASGPSTKTADSIEQLIPFSDGIRQRRSHQ